MSVFQAWQDQYIESERASLPAVHQWCSVRPAPQEWALWLDSMAGAHEHWGQYAMDALGYQKEPWLQFLHGAAISNTFKDKPIGILDYIRVSSVEMGRSLMPLPLVCVEALVDTMPIASPRWKQQLLVRAPTYWFGPAQNSDPALVAPLHELAAQLLCTSQFPAKRLPALTWSPSALYDDYGLPPDTVKHLQAPIQHALEYAVYVHQQQNAQDQLDHIEVHDYFARCGLDMGTFETLLELSSEAPTLDDYVRVIQAMLTPAPEQYHVDLNDETPQP